MVQCALSAQTDLNTADETQARRDSGTRSTLHIRCVNHFGGVVDTELSGLLGCRSNSK